MKRLQIEWRHLERSGRTCARCADTGTALREVVGALAESCRARGWEIVFTETRLSGDRLSESNRILVDGRDIEDILSGARASRSPCASCGELVGDPTVSCRAIELGGVRHEGIPPSLIRQAVCAVARCC